ncbi:hypothetical protein [Arcobacter vandammei]|uniref:hypothetical protein n=1 Tax=Arcobacter vandammei TaxID=2782243 RepID=UPI0018DF078E|nr:hypothetical protein [Arcobacter vandammei]
MSKNIKKKWYTVSSKFTIQDSMSLKFLNDFYFELKKEDDEFLRSKISTFDILDRLK